MISYSEFILERILIRESVFLYSDSFTKLISRIKSPISSNLLSLKGKDIDLVQNYIDISDENDSVTFILDSRASKIIDNDKIEWVVEEEDRFLTKSPKNKLVFDKLGIDLDGDYFNDPTEGDRGKILAETIGSNGNIYVLFKYTSGNNEGKMSVLNKGCLSEEKDLSLLWTTNRNKIKIGRFVRAILKSNNIEFTDKEIEDFVNKYKSEIEIMNNQFLKFDIVSGNLIAKFYNLDNYFSSTKGTLGNSCMAGKPDDYFDIYVANPERVRMVIMYDDNGEIKDGKYKSDKIVARALLWNTDQGEVVMDRIYTNFDKDVELFKKFAEMNKWWHKKNQNSESNFISQMGNVSKTKDYTIKLSVWDLDEYPYLDTFSYLDMENGILANNYEFGSGFTHALGNTNGTISRI